VILLVPNITIISLLRIDAAISMDNDMQSSPKRTVQINVRMSPEDRDMLRHAADLLWPDAELSNSGIVLGLAKLGAKGIFKKKGKKGS
jgi:hypothetical protein